MLKELNERACPGVIGVFSKDDFLDLDLFNAAEGDTKNFMAFCNKRRGDYSEEVFFDKKIKFLRTVTQLLDPFPVAKDNCPKRKILSEIYEIIRILKEKKGKALNK